MFSVAAPILDERSNIVAAIDVTAPTDYVTSALVETLRASAANTGTEISALLQA